jgi:hypothetical protein
MVLAGLRGILPIWQQLVAIFTTSLKYYGIMIFAEAKIQRV